MKLEKRGTDPNRFRRRVSWAALTIVALTTATSLAFAAKPRHGITVQIGGEPATLDPWRAIDAYSFSILHNVNQGLYISDRQGHLANALAESSEVSKDRLQYTFTIRDGARWSDGVPVRADDFVFGLQHALDPKTGCPNAELFFSIVNAREIYKGLRPTSSLGVSAVGRQLVVRLSSPDPILPLKLTLPAATPLRKSVWDQHQGVWTPDFPTTGDYTIRSYKVADEVNLKPIANLKDAEEVTFKIMPEEMTATNLFESGRFDIVSTLNSGEIDRLKTQSLVRIEPSTTVFYISFNLMKPPFRELRWRRAVAASLDREGLIKALRGAYQPVTSYLPPSIAGATPFRRVRDPEAARSVLNQKDKPHLHFVYGSSAFGKIVAEKVQSDLSKKLGLDVELEPVELKTLLTRLRVDPPEMYFLGMSATFDDPLSQLNAFSSALAPNFSRYVSPDYERALKDLESAEIGSPRRTVAEAANRRLTDTDAVVVPVVLRLQVFGVSKFIQDFAVNPYQAIQLRDLRKKK